MAELAVLGREEFVVGFRLAGIRRIFEAGEDPFKAIQDIRQQNDISVVIVDEEVMGKLADHDRNDIEDSIRPVFVPLSVESSQENLRRLIQKSIGVDLWEQKK